MRSLRTAWTCTASTTMRPALSALCTLLLASLTASQQPAVSVTKFENLPARLFYLEDTSAVFYHDIIEGIVHVSNDEGKSWKPAKDIPAGEALIAVEHPFDSRMAFVLTKGTKHYRTDDRGATWTPFHVPAQPAFVSNPLSFHSDKDKWGHILYLGTKCEKNPMGWGQICEDVTYYTIDGFANTNEMLRDTSRCQFAHSTKEFKHDAHTDMVYCVAFGRDGHSLGDSHLFQSTDFFKEERMIVDFDVGEKNARGVVALGISSKFAVAALKSPSTGEMTLYVTTDTKQWAQAKFPHASNSQLRENGYTIVESTTHSLGVDVLLHSNANVGNLFVSNSNGTYFVEALQDTNRNDAGFVDFENIVGVEGVGIANVVPNARDVEVGRATKTLRSVITFDDGSSWTPLAAPDCKTADCSLHLYSITSPHNFGRVFSSTAPGFVMGVGSVGTSLQPYDQCDTFLSTDAGVNWVKARDGAHKYEFGDKGAVLVVVDDEQPTDHISYSYNSGKTWTDLKLPLTVRAKVLTTVPDSTSQQFLLIGALERKDAEGALRYATLHIDFAAAKKRKCGKDDLETWRARTIAGKECLMGHKQSYQRKKPDADCYVGDKFEDPKDKEESCECGDEDYECDYNYVRSDGKCIARGPEPILPGECDEEKGKTKYMGSSGWRLIPGNTCKVTSNKPPKDAKVEKSCSLAEMPEGSVSHQTSVFDDRIVQHAYFKNSQTILVRLHDGTVWQSSNEGFSWDKRDGKYLAFYMHPYSDDRAYLVGPGRDLWLTTDTGRSWLKVSVPAEPNVNLVPVLAFHPKQTEYLIWTGAEGCPGSNCHARAWYSVDHGRTWRDVDSYVRTCSWARDRELKIDDQLILCESYRDKKGEQGTFGYDNPLQFIAGGNFYKEKRKVFDSVVGFAKFSEYLLVAELPIGGHGLSLQVSLDGRNFATGLFPPNMRIENHAYTILESTTDSVFLHLAMSTQPHAEWGNLMKSNSNGTYYSVSAEYVNRNEAGYVDFEKLIGLDGIAVVNIVANPNEAAKHQPKDIQTRITHNDGGSWKPLTPPPTDSLGQAYACKDVKCTLHLHGFTERYDVRATYSSPSVVGLMMAVGSVGEKLAGYTDSDTFISRDGGFKWEEVHKDAHLWEFGDSGSVLVMVNDEAPTDRVLYSLNEGKTWKEYQFANDDKMRVRSIVTISSDRSRKFILFGQFSRQPGHDVAVHLDFSQVTKTKCVMNLEDPGHDDFEFWSPSEEREERCLFGRRVLFHRRIREKNCFVGNSLVEPNNTETCACADVDFECEFNHIREDGRCVLAPGASPLPNDESCPGNAEFWYERTPYRKIPHSFCEGGDRPDRGTAHRCPGPGNHSAFFWIFISFVIISCTVLAAYYFFERSMHGPGAIRLPDSRSFDQSGPLSTLASVPWFLLGVVGVAWNWVTSLRLPFAVENSYRSRRRGYRHVPVDEDAQVLRFEDD